MFRTYVKKSFNGTLVSTQKRNTCEKNQGKKKIKYIKYTNIRYSYHKKNLRVVRLTSKKEHKLFFLFYLESNKFLEITENLINWHDS